MTAHARTGEADGILTVTLDRDEKRNAISPEITATLWDAVRELSGRDELRAMVITAVGRFFSAGIDMTAPSAANVAKDGREFRALYRRHHLLYDEFEAVEKPVVLAAQGPCLGAGLEMACSCDFRFASETARFELPEVRIGMIAGSGGTSRLTRLVGPHWAKWLAMAGRPVDAQQAVSMGLVHEVFPVEGFHEQVHQRVREIIELPPQALGAAKVAVDMVAQVDDGTARRVERALNTSLAFGDEFRTADAKWRSGQQ
ncbi:MAG TPA: enoyl-CoA hydratase/isomerase family protein [Amycolatopsis sp.]|nr:enoyl-CoA hydratase/isomerase family protein [Amycolatopsis sp.]